MKKLILLTVLLLVLITTGCSSDNGIYATVGENEITADTFEKHVLLTKISYDVAGTEFPAEGSALVNLKRNLLNNMIESIILVDAAKSKGITIDGEQAASDAKALIDMFEESYGADGYESLLKENSLTTKEFEEFVNKLSGDNLYIYGLYTEVTKDVKVTEKEAETFYTKNIKYYNYSTVSVKTLTFSEKDLAETAFKEINSNGASFDDTIAKYKGQAGVVDASDMGSIFYTDMPEVFSDKVFAIKPGEHTEIIESEGLYYIAEVYAIDVMDPIPFKEVVDDVKEKVLSEKRNTVYEGFFETEKAKYEIKAYYDKL
ncbi:MAG: hypothetical protein HGA49_00725 [Eubacteriaceae bacterium]|nr:hypothetical protein [Eubacteriaceae bacterium]